MILSQLKWPDICASSFEVSGHFVIQVYDGLRGFLFWVRDVENQGKLDFHGCKRYVPQQVAKRRQFLGRMTCANGANSGWSSSAG